MEIKLFFNSDTQGNTYVVTDNENTYIIDPGGSDMSSSINYIKDNNLDLKAILLTHGHFDHIAGIPEILSYKKVPIYISEKEVDFLYNETLSLMTWCGVDFKLDDDAELIKIKEGDNIFSFEIMETPGHTKGSICFYDKEKNILFTGDTIFKRAYGRTDFPTGDARDLRDSLNRVLKLPENTVIYPGHGEDTTVGAEVSVYYSF